MDTGLPRGVIHSKVWIKTDIDLRQGVIPNRVWIKTDIDLRQGVIPNKIWIKPDIITDRQHVKKSIVHLQDKKDPNVKTSHPLLVPIPPQTNTDSPLPVQKCMHPHHGVTQLSPIRVPKTRLS